MVMVLVDNGESIYRSIHKPDYYPKFGLRTLTGPKPLAQWPEPTIMPARPKAKGTERKKGNKKAAPICVCERDRESDLVLRTYYTFALRKLTMPSWPLWCLTPPSAPSATLPPPRPAALPLIFLLWKKPSPRPWLALSTPRTASSHHPTHLLPLPTTSLTTTSTPPPWPLTMISSPTMPKPRPVADLQLVVSPPICPVKRPRLLSPPRSSLLSSSSKVFLISCALVFVFLVLSPHSRFRVGIDFCF